MAAGNPECCCRGKQIAAAEGEFTQQTARSACKIGIHDAIVRQLEAEDPTPVVIDGLPTIGKTTQTTQVLLDLDIPAAILTHRYETRDEHLSITKEYENVAEIPPVDRYCETAKGEHGSEWVDRINDFRERGVSPTFFHYRLGDSLPCMQDGECEYLQQWERVENAQVLVGGPVHATLEDIVEDRVVVFDEDPGTEFRTEFDATQLSEAVSAFLTEYEGISLKNYGQVKTVAADEEAFAEQHTEIRDALEAGGRITRQIEALNADGGHVEAPTAILGLLELSGPNIGKSDDGSRDWTDDLRERVELDYAELSDGAEVVHDQRNSKFVIRRPPVLEKASAVVGLDGTPVKELWQGRLGVGDIEIERILCDDCRERYLCEEIGYTFVQTTDSVKPYSSGTHINCCSDFGLIEAVAGQHDEKPGVITSKKAKERLFEQDIDEPYVDPVRITEQIDDTKHYGALRSSNDFVGKGVGIVIGSPHPGDRAIQITAAFQGYIAERGKDAKGKTLTYDIPDEPFLHHYREHKVAQAVLRFGRTAPATVYIHTSVLPDWLAEIVDYTPDRVQIRKRGDGERSIIWSLIENGPGEAREIASREEVMVKTKQTRDWLKHLRDEGVVSRNDTQPYTWRADGIKEAPHTAHVTLPD